MKDYKSKLLKNFNRLNEITLEYPLSHMDDISNIIINENGRKLFKGCENNNIICESSLNRLLDHSRNREFAIITAYRNVFDKKQNIKRNRILRGILNQNKMGVHQLIGHWRECQLKGVDYDKCPEDQLVDSIERAYFVAKPDDMDSDEFKKLMLQLMTIEGHTQDSIVYHDGELVYILSSDGQVYDKFSELTLNKIAQAYSRHIKKQNIPFVFEGMEIPGSNSGKMIMKYENIKYIV